LESAAASRWSRSVPTGGGGHGTATRLARSTRSTFDRKTDAQRWLDEVTAAIVTGQYVDPRSGRITFREYAEGWRATQVHRLTTHDYIEGNLRRNAYPVLGDKPLSSIRPSEVQAWAKGMTDRLAPSTVGVVHGVVSGIFRAAVRDRLIVANPCDGTRLPKTTPSRVEPLPSRLCTR
jgi:hypothetical protein